MDGVSLVEQEERAIPGCTYWAHVVGEYRVNSLLHIMILGDTAMLYCTT